VYLVYAIDHAVGYRFIGQRCDRILESPAAAAADISMLGPGHTRLSGIADGARYWWLAAAVAFLGALAFITNRLRAWRQ